MEIQNLNSKRENFRVKIEFSPISLCHGTRRRNFSFIILLVVLFASSSNEHPAGKNYYSHYGYYYQQHFVTLLFSVFPTDQDYFDKSKMNGRFYGAPSPSSSYSLYRQPLGDEYNINQYDEFSHLHNEYQPPHHHQLHQQPNNPYNDIYGRMYSDRFHGTVTFLFRFQMGDS